MNTLGKYDFEEYDCGLKHGNVIFVSADGKLIEKIMGHDTSFLRIMEFRSLN